MNGYEKYKGHIWAENKPDQVTIFTFTLPLVPTDENNHINGPALAAEVLPV